MGGMGNHVAEPIPRDPRGFAVLAIRKKRSYTFESEGKPKGIF